MLLLRMQESLDSVDATLERFVAEMSEPEDAVLHQESEDVAAEEGAGSGRPEERREAPVSVENMDNLETQAIFDSRAEDLHSDGEAESVKRPERSALKAGLLSKSA